MTKLNPLMYLVVLLVLLLVAFLLLCQPSGAGATNIDAYTRDR